MNINKIKKNIKKYDIISFDIFDTLLKRNVSSPLDIFDLVEKEYNNNFLPKIYDFKKNRIIAQKKLRCNNLKTDYNYDDIYIELSNYYSEDEIQRLKILEKKIEKNNLTKNIIIYDLFQLCKDYNKKIICVSDMYFDSNFLSEILCSCGYDGIEQIFVSSEYNATKSNGNLYNIVKKKYDHKKILHIGDSKRGDYINSRIRGIKSIKIPTKIEYLKYSNEKSNKNLSSILNNYYLYNKNDVFNVGYEIYGPLLYGFMKWIEKKEKKINPQNIYFFARDTRIIYDNYKEYKSKKHYVYISRKSIRGAYLYLFNTYEEIKNLISIDKMSFEKFLSLLNLDFFDVNLEAEKCGLFLLKDVSLSNDYEKLSNFVTMVKEKIINANKNAYDSLYKYLEQINYFDENGLIVDSGWNGTIQYCLNKMFPKNIKYGVYIGLENKAYDRIDNQYIDSYIFGKNIDDEYKKAIISIKQLFELSISETCGSTLSYKIEKGISLPILEEKSNDYGCFVNELQKGIKYFFKICDNINFDFNKSECFSYLNEFIVNPKLKHAEIFLNFSTNNLEQQLEYKYCDKSIIYYVLNLRKFCEDLKKSPWKVGFLKLVFKVKLPYYKFYLKLKERV